MSTLADRGIAALRTNYDDLATRVREFDDDDLARQSGASEWTVADALSHLGSAAEIMLATLSAAVSGEERKGSDFNQSVWDRWNAMTPREQADGYLRANEQLVSAYESLDDDTRENLRITVPFLPAPVDVATLAGMRLNEAALHGWDVRVAFDDEAGLTAEEAEFGIQMLTGPLGVLVGFMGKSDRLGVSEAALRVETTDPQRDLGLVLAPKAAVGAPPDDPAGVLTAPAEALVRLIAGRLGPDHTPATVSLTSDVVTLDQVRSVFPGY